MARTLETSLDFNKQEALNMVIQVLGSDPGSPTLGQMYFNSGSDKIRTYNGATWDEYSAGGNTNLTFSRDGTTVTVESDTGTDAILPAATGALAGVMIAADKTKLDAITGTNTGDEPDASDTVKGIIEIAIQAEVDAGSDSVRAVTPDTLQVKIDAEIAAALTTGMDFKGPYNASTDTPALDTGSPTLEIGDMYTVTVAGTFFSEELEIGDVIISEVDSTDAADFADWTILQKNLDQAVIGPGSAVDNRVVFFDGTSGTLIKDSGLTLAGNNTGDEVTATESLEGITEIATQGETDALTVDNRHITPLKLGVYLKTDDASLNVAVRYTEQIGNASLTTIVVTHNIGNQFVVGQVFRTASPFDLIVCDVEADTTNAMSFTFNAAPATNEFTVVITG